MLRKTLPICIGLLLFVNGAFGDIVVWTNNANLCTIVDAENKIQINSAGTFGFRGETSGVLNEIAEIKLGPSVSGTVTVTIAYDAYGGVGATNVETINIRASGVNGVLAGIYISGELANEGDVICDNLTGAIDVGGSLHEDGHSQEYTYDLEIDGSVDGSIYIERIFGSILVSNGAVAGDITTGEVPGGAVARLLSPAEELTERSVARALRPAALDEERSGAASGSAVEPGNLVKEVQYEWMRN